MPEQGRRRHLCERHPWAASGRPSGDEGPGVGLSLVKCFKVRNADGGIVFVVNPTVVQDQDIGVVAQHFPSGLEQLVSNADGRTNGGVGVHERDTAGIGAKVNRAGIALVASDVDHFHGQRQDLSHHLSHSGCRTLADVCSTGVNGYATVHVNLDVNGGVWEILRIPVNGQPRT